MNQTVLDVLIYIFEHYMDDETEFSVDQDTLRVELKASGFDESQVIKAFEWLEGLSAQQENIARFAMTESSAIRIYTRQEAGRLDTESQGFLLFLEQIGVLAQSSRELVIDRVMALESGMINLEQLKWIVLMVLFNQPGYEDAFGWMEDFVMDEHSASSVLH